MSYGYPSGGGAGFPPPQGYPSAPYGGPPGAYPTPGAPPGAYPTPGPPPGATPFNPAQHGAPPGAFQFSSQYMQHYNMWQQPSQQYGSYGSFYQNNVFQTHAYQAYNMSGNNDLWQIFDQEVRKNGVNMRKQALQSEDLCNILNNTPAMRNYYGIYWSKELCSIMIAMLDRSGDGFMQWEEYMELQQCLVAWFNVFRQNDTNRSGFIEANELNGVISQLFDAFRRRDGQQHPMREEGHCGFSYDDFLRVVLSL